MTTRRWVDLAFRGMEVIIESSVSGTMPNLEDCAIPSSDEPLFSNL